METGIKEVIDCADFPRIELEKGRIVESVFAGFCRTIELSIERGYLNRQYFDHANSYPLVLFETEKAKRALEWAQLPIEDIRIPFKSCIVADNAGVVMLENAKIVKRENDESVFHQADIYFDQKGYKRPTHCALVSFAVYLDYYFVEQKDFAMLVTGQAKIYHVSEEKHRFVDVFNIVPIIKTENEVFLEMENEDRIKASMVDAGTSLNTSLEQLQYIIQPGNYVVTESFKNLKIKEGKKIARAHQRKRIRVLDPEEMRKVYLSSKGGHHLSPLPHLRMGHWRQFKSDKFTHMKGQKIWIDEIQVKAGTQWEYQGKIYKVMERKSYEEKENIGNEQAPLASH